MHIKENTRKPSWELVKCPETNVLICSGRITAYTPIYLENSPFVQKLIRYVHERVMHLRVASTMAEVRKCWWIPHLRSLVKKTNATATFVKCFPPSD